MNPSRLSLRPWAAAVIALSGFVSLVATYWDDAWHTDLGRDSARIPPHLWLYGSVAVAGAAVIGWGVRSLLATRSLRAVLRQSPLLVAAAGGAATLAAAPLDAVWHASFGRDAVLWSPPHMLVIFASAAMILGVITGTARSRSGAVEALLAGLLLGTAAMTVMEYETDVPQFSEALYLSVLLVAALSTAVVARAYVPTRAPVTAMVVVYIALRLVAAVVLGLLGRTAPELPVAILGLGVLDLPWRNMILRYSAGAAAVSLLAWLASVTGLVSRSASEVAVVAVPVLVVFAVVLIATVRRGWPIVLALFAIAASAGLIGIAPPASAHDPGEGEPVLGAHVTGGSDGQGMLSLTVRTDSPCTGLVPTRVVARRAGQTIRGSLLVQGDCQYSGSVRVPADGRWLVYAELRRGDENIEAWLPLDADRATAVTESRDLYRPAEATASTRWVQIAAGAGIYALAIGLVGAAAAVALHRRREVAAA